MKTYQQDWEFTHASDGGAVRHYKQVWTLQDVPPHTPASFAPYQLTKTLDGWTCTYSDGRTEPHVECANGAVVPVEWLDADGLYHGSPVVAS